MSIEDIKKDFAFPLNQMHDMEKVFFEADAKKIKEALDTKDVRIKELETKLEKAKEALRRANDYLAKSAETGKALSIEEWSYTQSSISETLNSLSEERGG